MLKDAREAEIMADARQPGLREATRSVAELQAIIEDFNLGDRLEGHRILDLGPGQFDFGELVRTAGGALVGVDDDPAVVQLGEYRGYEAQEVDLRTLDPANPLGEFDGLFSRSTINAVWFENEEEHLAWIDRIASLVREDGWAWLAPWNDPRDGTNLDRERDLEIVYAQFRGLTRNGFLTLHLPRADADRYGLSGGGLLQEGETVFVRNVAAKPELLRYMVTRTDFDGFLVATRRTMPAAGAPVRSPASPDAASPAANVEVPSTAGSPREEVSNPPRGISQGDRIIANFALASRCAAARVLSVGASDFDLARAARERGTSEVVIIDRTPELVEKAVDLGFTAHLLNPRQLRGDEELGEYDVVLCRGSINAFWFGTRHAEHERWVMRLAALLKPGGAAWIAPWNAPGASTDLTEDDRREIVETQLSAFLAAGFDAHELDRGAATTYGVSGDVENLVLFTKGLDADAVLGSESRPADPKRASHLTRHTASSASRPVPVVHLKVGSPIVPVEYHTGLLDLLAANPDVFNVITYDDLPWGSDLNHEEFYPAEWETWLGQVRDTRDQRIHVLIQHDVDTYPELTNSLAEYEAQVGVPTNIMIFRRRHDRELLATEGRIEFREYGVDIPLLQRLQQESRFVIGYHANCMEHALWDQHQAQRLFVDDVTALRESFPIRYFSPHGGVGKDGINNTSIQIADELRGQLRWVHNRYGPKFHGYHSDGGFASKPRGDIRDFVRTWRPGCRYRILTHPQYYGTDALRRDYDLAWYQELVRAYDEGQRQFWDDVWPDALS